MIQAARDRGVQHDMSPAWKDDESVQTSLRALMKQEEDRLEQLRAAKVRIDRERAEAAREAEEERQRLAREEQAELEAKKAAAVERARIEATPMPPKIVEIVVPAPPNPTRFDAGFAIGFAFAAGLAAIGWFALIAPRLAHAAKLVEVAHTELEVEKSAGRDVRAKLDARDREIDMLQNELLRRRAPEPPKISPKTNTPAPRRVAPSRPNCDPHDPLCGDL